jgi:hypothetical protein
VAFMTQNLAVLVRVISVFVEADDVVKLKARWELGQSLAVGTAWVSGPEAGAAGL